MQLFFLVLQIEDKLPSFLPGRNHNAKRDAGLKRGRKKTRTHCLAFLFFPFHQNTETNETASPNCFSVARLCQTKLQTDV
mmetsp:Transcript_51228/g.100615  ORF Transcript_51228/g.100615 Transcript_51228/m.100615 type:complete len:80 (+) Transcript_51228:705-944(+)